MSLPTTVVFMSGIFGRLAALEKQHGSLRAVSRVLKIDNAYLYRLKTGEKLNPSDAVLRKLGLRRMVQFINGASAMRASSTNG